MSRRSTPRPTGRLVVACFVVGGFLASLGPVTPATAQPDPSEFQFSDGDALAELRRGLVEGLDDPPESPAAPDAGIAAPGVRPESATGRPAAGPPGATAGSTEPRTPSLDYLSAILAAGSVPQELVGEITDEQMSELVTAAADSILASSRRHVPPDDVVAPPSAGEPALPAGRYSANAAQLVEPDGSRQVTVSADGRFVLTEDGWARFDPTIAPPPAGSTDIVGVVATPVGGVEFAGGPAAMVGIELPAGDVTMGIDLPGLGSPEVDGAEVTYSAPAAGVEVVYEALPSGIKEQIILRDATSPRSFTFTIDDADGVLGEPEAVEDGSWRFVDPRTERVRAVMPPLGAHDASVVAGDGSVDPFAWDLAAASAEVVAVEGGFEVTVTVDDEWLEGRSFPVTVDPTITFSSGTGHGPVSEGFVYDSPNCPSNGCLYWNGGLFGVIPFGGSGSSDPQIALERWKLWDASHTSPDRLVPPRAAIDSATFDVHVGACYDPPASGNVCDNTDAGEAYELTGNWSIFSRFPDIQARMPASPADTVSPFTFGGTQSYDLTDVVQGWALQ